MTTQIACQYVAFSGIVAPSAMATLMAAVPVDPTMPDLYGLRLQSDATTTGTNGATRTLTYTMLPAANAAGTAQLGGPTGGTLISITRTAAGFGYSAAPVVTLQGGNPQAPASAIAVCVVIGVQFVLAGGSSYSATPTVTAKGGQLAPGGTLPTFAATVVAGSITTISTVTPGGPYIVAPQLVITDPSGSGAIAVASMAVDHFVVTSPGVGYQTVPTVVVTPLYKSIVPAGAPIATEQAVLASFMKAAFDSALRCNVDAPTPIVT